MAAGPGTGAHGDRGGVFDEDDDVIVVSRVVRIIE
jgi:hypothetical protein